MSQIGDATPSPSRKPGGWRSPFFSGLPRQTYKVRPMTPTMDDAKSSVINRVVCERCKASLDQRFDDLKHAWSLVKVIEFLPPEDRHDDMSLRTIQHPTGSDPRASGLSGVHTPLVSEFRGVSTLKFPQRVLWFGLLLHSV